MEVIGYVITILTFIVGLAIKLVRGIDTTIIDSIDTIKEEFRFAYREFGTVANEEGRESEMFDMSLARLSRLHSSSTCDLIKIKILDWVIGKTTFFVYFLSSLVLISIIIASLEITKKNAILQSIFYVIIPFLLLCIQILFICWIISRERYLKRVIKRYERKEY